MNERIRGQHGTLTSLGSAPKFVVKYRKNNNMRCSPGDSVHFTEAQKTHCQTENWAKTHRWTLRIALLYSTNYFTKLMMRHHARKPSEAFSTVVKTITVALCSCLLFCLRASWWWVVDGGHCSRFRSLIFDTCKAITDIGVWIVASLMLPVATVFRKWIMVASF
jgi:hypothetical protein